MPNKMATASIVMSPDAGDPTPGITRRSTADALQRLQQLSSQPSVHSKWYEPGKDFGFYSSAQDACRLCEASLKKLKLSHAERDLLEKSDSLDIIVKRMKAVMKEYDDETEQSPAVKKLGRFVNSFCEFATRMSGLVQILLPNSPEYTITFGSMMIIFTAVVEKQEKQDALSDFLEKLTNKLPILDFYRTIFPTNDMKTTVAALYVAIIVFLEQAARYYCTGRLGKLLDAVFKPIEYDFDVYLMKIDVHTEKLNDLKEAAHMAQTADMKEVLEASSKVIVRLHENFENAVVAIGSSLSALDRRIDLIQSRQKYITSFQAKSYVQTLKQAAFYDITDIDEEFHFVKKRDFRLSEKDQWENNGILDQLLNWSQNKTKPAFWVDGKSGNQDSWVTQMSKDLIEAFETQEKVITFVFCGNGKDDSFPWETTPTTILKRLILQILDIDPLLAFHNPERLNARRLKKVQTFDQLWDLWEYLAKQVKDLFLVIDRIDKSLPDETVGISVDFLPKLLDSTREIPGMSIIFTSSTRPATAIEEHEMLQTVCLDTGIPPRKRHERSTARDDH